MTIKRYLFLLLITPLFAIGQSITQISVTDSIYCNGDPECIDIDIINFSEEEQYDLWIWRDFGLVEYQLIRIVEDVLNDSIFESTEPNAGTINYCFNSTGNFILEIYNSTSETVSDTVWNTMAWPVELGINQMISNNELSCNGDSDGVLKVNGTGGVQPLTFNWTGPNGYSFTQNQGVISEIDNLTAGNYFLTVADDNGCENNSFTGLISEPTPVSVDISLDILESCFDSLDAQLTAIASGGNDLLPYLYSWDSGETTATLTTGAGFHAVTVQDSEGCLGSDFIELAETPQLLVDNIIVNDAECVDIEGSVVIIASGGTGNIFYDWPNGTSTNNYQALLAEDYTIDVTDENGCLAQASFMIDQADSLEFSLNSVSNANCFNSSDGEISFSINGGSSPFSVVFNGENSLPQQYFNIFSDTSFQSFGADDYQVLISDANGCNNLEYLDSVSLFEPSDLMVIDTLIMDVSCYGSSTGSIEVTLAGGYGEYVYSWTDQSNTIIGTESIISGLSQGIYTLTVNDSVCSKSFSFEIFQPLQISYQSAPIVSDITCYGANDGSISGVIIQGGILPYQYSWITNGDSFDEPNPNALEPGQYILDVKDANECEVTFPMVEIVEPIELIFHPTSVITSPSCFNINDGSVNINVVGGIPNYEYILEETSTGALYLDNDVENLPSGDYLFKAIDSNDCELDSLFVFDNPIDLVFNSTTNDLNCFESNDGFIAYSYDELIPPYTIYFEGAIQANDTIFALAAGNYTSVLKDGNGCLKTIYNTIIQPEILSYSSEVFMPSCNDDNLLQNGLISNGQVTLEVFGGSGYYDVILNEDSSQIETAIPLEINNLAADSYDIDIIDSQGCSLSFSETVESPTPINVYANITDIILFGDATGSIDITITGGQTPYNISWSGPSFVSNTEDINSLVAGIYTLTVIDANECYEIFEYAVNQGECNLQINPDTLFPSCAGDNAIINFDLYGGLAPYTCYMQGDFDSDGNIDDILPNTVINSSLVNDLVLPAGTQYTLFVQDEAECLLTYNFVIPAKEPIELTANVLDASCYGFDDGKIIIDPLTDISGGTAPYSVEWLGLDLNPVDPYSLTSGQYIVKVSDDENCEQEEYYTVNEPTQITLVDAIVTSANCEEGTNDAASDGSIAVIAQGGNTAGTGLYQYHWSNSSVASLQNIDGLSPGLYSVTIWDQTNCFSVPYEFEVLSPQFIEFVNYTSEPVSCHNSCDGSISVNTSNTSTDLFYWYDASDSVYIGNSNSLNGLCEGSYYFAIENDQNCFRESPSLGIGNITLDNPDEFIIDLDESPSVPNGVCDGLASVISTTGVGTVTYEWSTGETTSTIENLCGNVVYQVIATDENNCQSFEQFIIDEEECAFTIGNLKVENISCNNENDGKIYSQIPFQGGYPPYSIYLYNQDVLVAQSTTNSNLVNFSSLSEGEYFVIVEDIGGCLSTFSTSITNPSPLSYSYSIENSNCYNSFNPEVHITISGGTPLSGDTLYLVEFGFEHYLSFEENGFEYYIPGNSVIPGNWPLIVSDSLCTSPVSPSNEIFVVDVNDIDSIIVEVETFSPKCNGDSNGMAILSFTGGQGPYDINWYQDGIILPIAQSVTFVEGLSAGNYYVSVSDTLECETIYEFEIVDIEGVSLVSQLTLPSCIGLSNGSISTIVSGGNGGYNYLWSPGSMISNNIFGIPSGEYDLIITDQKGCVHVETIELDDPDPILIDFEVTEISCYDATDASIEAFPTQGAGNYNYQWFMNGAAISTLDGGISPEIINLSAAEYTVEVSDALNCTESASVNLIEPLQLELDFEIENPSCVNANDGSVITSISGGFSPYTHNITNSLGDTLTQEFYFNQLIAGTYSFNVTDSSACQLTEDFTIVDPDQMVLTLDVQDVLCNSDSNGIALLSIDGGISPYSISWYQEGVLVPFTDSALELSALSIGNYSVNVQDDLGCETSADFTINNVPNFSIDFEITPPSCIGSSDAAISTIISGSNGDYNFLWSPGSMTSNNVSGLSAGAYDLIITDQNSCEYVQTFIVEDPEDIVVDLDITPISCYGEADGAISATASFGAGSYSYQWYLDGNAISTFDGGISPDIINLSTGVYSIEVTDSSDCSTIASHDLNQPSSIEINMELTNPSCFGTDDGQLLANVSGGVGNYQYALKDNFGLVVSEEFYSNQLYSGSYNFVVTDGSLCQDSAIYILEDSDQIQLNVSVNNVNCYSGNDGSATFDVQNNTGFVNHTWYRVIALNDFEAISFSDTLNNNITEGNYIIEVEDSLGCTQSEFFTVEQPDSIEISVLTSSSLCSNVNGATAMASSENAAEPVSYIWTINQGDNITQFGDFASDLNPGIIYLNGTDANNCALPLTVVDIPESENALIQVQIEELVSNNCYNNSQAQLQAVVYNDDNTSINSNVLYQWYFNGATVLSSQGGTINILSDLGPGIYSVEVTHENYGCVNSDTIELVNPQQMNIDIITEDIDCFGDSTGTALATVTNGTLPLSYQWNNSMGLTLENDVFNPSNLIAGIYELVVSDDNDCQQSQVFQILENDSLGLEVNAQSVSCYSGSDGILYSSVIGGYGAYSYQWRNEANEIVSISPSATNLSAQNYTIILSDELDCSVTSTITLEQANVFEIDKNIVDVNCYGYSTGSISLDVTGGTGELNYEWSSSEENVNQLINLSAGTYDVVISDAYGCQISKSYTVEQSPQLEASAEGIFQSCTEGIVNITSVEGGTPPYDFFWLDDPTNETMSISNLSPGYHTFIISDIYNCMLTDSALISGSNEIFTSITSDSVLCNNDSSGFVTVSILNDDNYPYYYSINDATSFGEMIVNPTFVIDNLPIGDYTIFIKDGENCIDTTDLVSIYEPVPLEFQVSSSDVLCYANDDGTISVEASGGIAPYDISLDGGNSFNVLNDDGYEILNVFSGDYEVLISDHNGCIESEFVSINQPDQLVFSLSDFSDFNGYNNSCYNSNDASLTINLSGGTGDIELSFADSLIIVSDGFVLENMSQGSYSFFISDGNLCSSVIDTVITSPDTLSLSLVSTSDFNGSNTSCYGVNDASSLVSASGGVGPYDYSFDGGISYIISNTFNEYEFENLSSGLVTFQLKDDNDCIDTFTYEITSPQEIIPSLTIYSPVDCYGNNEAILLAQVQGGTSVYSYELSSQEDTITFVSSEISNLFTDLTAGFYELNVTDINGCSNNISNASQINIPQPELLSYDINIGEISCNSAANGNIEINNISGGVGSYSFKLYNTLGYFFEDIDLGSFDLLSFDSLSAATYMLIISDENNCEIIDTLVIDNPEILSVTAIGSDAECYGIANGNVELLVEGGTSPYTLVLNNETYKSTEAFLISGLMSNNYNYQLIDDSGCEYFSEILISQPDSIVLDYSIENNLCFNQSYGAAEFNVSGGVPPYSYQFTDENGILISDSNSISNLMAATYFITVSDSNACIYDQEVVITEPTDIIIVNDIINESCSNANDGSIFTSVSNYQGSYEVFWSSEGLSGVNNANLNPGEYILTIVDNLGCFKMDTIIIESAANLDFYTSSSATECLYTNDGTLSIEFAEEGSYFVQLSNGTDSYQNSTINDIVFENLSANDYNMIINYDSSCVFDTVISISNQDGYDCIVPEPTFSPNFDGVNDEFAPARGFNETIELLIYNRWGAKLFSEESVNPKWDGTDLNGNLVPSSDYYYIIKFNNTLFNDITGIITLLK